MMPDISKSARMYVCKLPNYFWHLRKIRHGSKVDTNIFVIMNAIGPCTPGFRNTKKAQSLFHTPEPRTLDPRIPDNICLTPSTSYSGHFVWYMRQILSGIRGTGV